MGRPAARWIVFLLPAVYLLALLPLVKSQTGSVNDESRMGAMAGLAENHTNALHPAFAGTLDRALRDDGAFISDKPPLLNVIGAGVLIAAESATDWTIETSARALYRAVAVAISALPAALTLLLLGLTLIALNETRKWMIALTVILAAVTTLLTPYAVTIANHAAAAVVVMALVRLILMLEQSPTPRSALFLGLVAGSVWLIDVPVGGVLLLVTGAFVAMRHRKSLGMFSLGACVPVLVGLLLNRLLTMRCLPVYFHGDMYEYEGSVWSYASKDLPAAYPLRVFERCIIFTVGDQGVFLMWPLAILAFIGVWYAMRSPRMPGEKSLALWTLAAWVCVLGALIFNPSARGSDVGGGYGLRWIIPLMAPLLLFLPRALDGRGLGAKIALVPLTLWGLMIVTLGVANPWPLCSMSRFPPLHNLAEIAASRSGGYITLPDIIINETSPEPALGHFDLGMLQFNQARHVLAKRQFNEALNCADEMPTHKFDPVLARYYLGISLTETGQFLEARGNYLVLLEMAPDNVGARNNAAIMYMRWGRPADALEQARESARLDPRSVSARVLSVQALLALNRIEEAAESIRAAFADGLIDARLAGLARRLDVPVPDVQGGN